MADKKIVICDKCGERFDYIPETCPKCGEILSARMDPDARSRIEYLLRPKDKIKYYLIITYFTFISFIFGVVFIFVPFENIAMIIVVTLPLIIGLIISIIEKKEKRSYLFHSLVVLLYICNFMIPSYGSTGNFVCPFFIVSTICISYYEYYRGRLSLLLAIGLTLIILLSFGGSLSVYKIKQQHIKISSISPTLSQESYPPRIFFDSGLFK